MAQGARNFLRQGRAQGQRFPTNGAQTPTDHLGGFRGIPSRGS